VRVPSPVGAKHPTAFFRSAAGAKAPEPTAQAVGQQAEIDRSPARGERGPRPSRVRVLVSPLQGLIELRHNTHGLRRGLGCFRAYGASEWPADPRRCSFRPRGCAAVSRGTAMKHGRALTPALRPFHSRGDAAGVWGTIVCDRFAVKAATPGTALATVSQLSTVSRSQPRPPE